jgi:hypothetical protein
MFEKYIGQPLKTRSGDDAIVLGVLEDKVNGKHLFGAFMTDENGWCPTTWHLDGRWLTDNPFEHDLVFPKRRIWVLWGDPTFTFYTEEKARRIMREHPFHTLQEITEP